VVVCLEQGANLHMAQLMPLPLTVSCFSKIQIGFTFLVPAHLGSPGKIAVKWVCVCVCVCLLVRVFNYDVQSWVVISLKNAISHELYLYSNIYSFLVLLLIDVQLCSYV